MTYATIHNMEPRTPYEVDLMIGLLKVARRLAKRLHWAGPSVDVLETIQNELACRVLPRWQQMDHSNSTKKSRRAQAAQLAYSVASGTIDNLKKEFRRKVVRHGRD